MRRSRFLLVLIVISVLSFNNTFSKNIILTEEYDPVSIGKYLEVLEDSDRSFNIKMVSDDLGNLFLESNSDVPNYGNTESAYWARFTIENRSQTDRWILLISRPSIDYITFYYENGGELLPIYSGRQVHFSERQIKHRYPAFYLDSKNGSQSTVYIRFETTEAMALDLEVMTESVFARKNYVDQFYVGVYYGILMLIILYNISVFCRFEIRLISIIFCLLPVLHYLIWQGMGLPTNFFGLTGFGGTDKHILFLLA